MFPCFPLTLLSFILLFVDLETTAKGEHLLTALFGVCIENCTDVVTVSQVHHKLSLTFVHM